MDKLRLGFIGCGGMARHHGREFVGLPDTEIVALCDTSKDSLDAFTADVFKNNPQTSARYSDYKQMLKREKLDGVVIVSPHTLHGPQILASLTARAHVLVEKPMVTSVADARKIVAAQKKSGLIVSIAFQGVHSAEFAYIRQLIRSGQLGDLHLIHAHVVQNWKRPTSGSWRQNPKLSGGGQAYDSGAHMFSAILDLSGLSPVEIFASTNNKDAPVDIIAAATIRFENGCLATAAVSGDASTFDEGIALSGTEGYIKTAIYGGRIDCWDKAGNLIKNLTVPPQTNPQQNFVDCIRGKAATPASPALGLRHALLMDAFYKSAKIGKPVKIAAK